MTQKSDRLQKLVEDPDLIEAFENVRMRYLFMIEESPVSDDTALLDIRKMLHLLKDVKEDLFNAIKNGKLEDFNAIEHPGTLKDLLNGKPN